MRASLLDKELKVNTGNSVQCTLCIKWIHKRFRFICGDLLLVADGFRCKRSDWTIQEADLVNDLVVDGEASGCVKELWLSGRHS